MSTDDAKVEPTEQVLLALGWRMYEPLDVAHWQRSVEIPAGHYYALHWRPGELPVAAARPSRLLALVADRNPADGLAARNRRVIAERCGWPDLAVETCEALDAEHPGWVTGWLDANDIPGWERPAGYVATLIDGPHLVGGDQLRRLPEDGVSRQISVFAETEDELVELIAAADARVEAHELEQRRLWESVRRGVR
jgi:hypothetical protein